MVWVRWRSRMWHWVVKCLEAAKKELRRKSKTNSSICCILSCPPWGGSKPEPYKCACLFWALAAPLGMGCGSAGGGYFFSLPPTWLTPMLLYQGQVSGLQLPREQVGTLLLFWTWPLVDLFVFPPLLASRYGDLFIPLPARHNNGLRSRNDTPQRLFSKWVNPAEGWFLCASPYSSSMCEDAFGVWCWIQSDTMSQARPRSLQRLCVLCSHVPWRLTGKTGIRPYDLRTKTWHLWKAKTPGGYTRGFSRFEKQGHWVRKGPW